MSGSICDRAAVFDIPTRTADTWDVEELLSVVSDSIAAIRRGESPLFLPIDTYRLMAHSQGDDDPDPEEISTCQQRDPLNEFGRSFPDLLKQFQTQIRQRIDAAVAAAVQALFAELPAERTDPQRVTKFDWQPLDTDFNERSVSLIRQSLERALEHDQRVVIISEDIESPYGGASKRSFDFIRSFPAC